MLVVCFWYEGCCWTCVSVGLLSWSLKSFDILLMSASLWIVVVRCIVTLERSESTRRDMVAMLNTYLYLIK